MPAPRIRITGTRPCRNEVRFADGRGSKFFYFDECWPHACGPRSSAAKALEQVKALARAERDKG